METKIPHTPGEWEVHGGNVYALDIPPSPRYKDGQPMRENRLTVQIYGATWAPEDEALASANLIAAAPKLLAALRANIEGRVRMSANACHPSKRFCDVCGTNSEKVVHSPNCPINLAEIAIAKAEGHE